MNFKHIKLTYDEKIYYFNTLLTHDTFVKLKFKLVHYEGLYNLREIIIEESHGSHFSSNPGDTEMYNDIRPINWWNGIKIGISNIVARFSHCEQVKAKP